MALQAGFGPDAIEVRPGDSAVLVLDVANLGERTESVTLLPTGPAAAWVSLSRSNLTVFGGSSDTVEVTVRPPAIHTTSAGPTTLAVRAVPLVDADDAAVAEATLHVLPFDDRRISMLQPLRRARRRATFELMVENHGNNLASCRLHLVDPSNRVDGSFDPPAVGVAPGASALVQLKLRATSIVFRRQDRQLDFEVEATQSDHDTASARAALIQPPTVPGRVVGAAVALAVLGAAIVAAWFGVIRPEIRDAADRAVADRLAGGPPAVTEPGDDSAAGDDAGGDVAPPPADGTRPDGAADRSGEPFAARLPLRISVGGTNADGTSVPAGARLLLTDVVLQNPSGDLGTASLLRNDEVLYDWDLGLMASANEFQPRLTPLPFDAGDELVFRATCTDAGNAAATGCEVAVLVAGQLVTDP